MLRGNIAKNGYLRQHYRGVARSKNVGWTGDTHGEHAEREPITESGGRTPPGSRGRASGQEVRGKPPLNVKTF